MKGFDLSVSNMYVDFNKLKNKYDFDFVILRAGWLNYEEGITFRHRCNKAKEAGLKVGAYWYSYARNCQAVEKEATACLSALENVKLDLPIFYDFEEISTIKPTDNIALLLETFSNIVSSKDREIGFAIDIVSAAPYVDFYNEIAKEVPMWLLDMNQIRQFSNEESFNKISNSLNWTIKEYDRITIDDCNIYGDTINLNLM